MLFLNEVRKILEYKQRAKDALIAENLMVSEYYKAKNEIEKTIIDLLNSGLKPEDIVKMASTAIDAALEDIKDEKIKERVKKEVADIITESLYKYYSIYVHNKL